MPSKFFNLVGIASNVLFGSAGARIRSISGSILEARNNADAAFAILRGATPVGNNDLATKQYVDSSAGAGSIIMFGAQNISAAVAVRYLYPGFSNNQAPTAPAAPDTPPSYRVPRAGTIRRLYVRQNDPRGNGNAVTYRLRVGGVVTALSVTMASTAYDASDLVSSVAVAQGARIDFEAWNPLALGTSPYDIFATMEFL